MIRLSALRTAHATSGPPPISQAVGLQLDGHPNGLPSADGPSTEVRSIDLMPARTGPTDTHVAQPTSVRRTIADTDLSVHPLALGTSVFGWTVDGPTSIRILDRHRELGGNFIDTADSYAAGRSEALIGSWMRTRGARDETVIATKIGRNRDNPRLTAESITGAVHASLERLGTDYIDLLYFHFDDVTVELEESLGAVDALIRRGQVRYLAASDFSAERLMEARVLSANGLPRFVALETHYNLVHRQAFESSLAIASHAQGLSVLPYFALAHGFLAGNSRTKAQLTANVRGARAGAYLNRSGLRVLDIVDRIAAEHDVQPATIALAWLLARDGVVAPVAGASRPEQVDALVAAAGIRLSRGDMVHLDRVSEWNPAGSATRSSTARSRTRSSATRSRR